MGYVYLEESCVRYEEGDVFGHLLAYFSLGHVAVVLIYCTLVIAVRDIQIVAALGVQLICAKFTSLLKKMIAQPRPDSSDIGGSGMPSNHSQFLFFFATFHALCLFYCTGRQLYNADAKRKRGVAWRVAYCLLLFGFASAVAYSRIYLHYHTTEQVLAGSLLGVLLGSIGFYVIYCNDLTTSVQRAMCQLPVMKYFNVHFASDFYYPPRRHNHPDPDSKQR